MLTGSFAADNAPADTDFRGRMQPRFEGEAYAANLKLVEEIVTVADTLGLCPGQVALAWVIGRGEGVLTIPGTTKLQNLESNLAAGTATLTVEQHSALLSLADRVQGARYDDAGMARLNG